MVYSGTRKDKLYQTIRNMRYFVFQILMFYVTLWRETLLTCFSSFIERVGVTNCRLLDDGLTASNWFSSVKYQHLLSGKLVLPNSSGLQTVLTYLLTPCQLRVQSPPPPHARVICRIKLLQFSPVWLPGLILVTKDVNWDTSKLLLSPLSVLGIDQY